MAVVAVANQKGGVGKTTTVVNLGAALQQLGKRVLLVDFDPQASLTVHLGIKDPESLQASCGHVLRAAATGNRWPTFRDVLIQTPAGLDLVPSGRQLAVAELLLHTVLGRELIFREYLAPLRDEYEFILIDCLPTTNILVVNALTAADAILVPVQTDYLATQGLAQILQTVATIRERLNPRLEVLGILLTMVDTRTTHSRQIVSAVRRSFQGKIRVFDTMIRLQVALKESSKAGVSVLRYDPQSPSAMLYRNLANEVLAVVEEIGYTSTPHRRSTDGWIASPIEEAMVAVTEAERLAREVMEAGAEDGDSGDDADSEVAQAVPAPSCPLLGLADDRGRRLAEPGDAHRCYAGEVPLAVDNSTQREMCLHSRYRVCPQFIRHSSLVQSQTRTSTFARLRSLFRVSAPER